MIKNLENILESKYISIAGIIALLLSPLADAIDNNFIFWGIFIVLVLIIFYSIYDEYMKSKKIYTDIIHIPMVIKVGEGISTSCVMDDLVEQIQEFTGLKNYKNDINKYLKVNIDSLIYEYKGNIYDFENLLNFIRIIKYEIKKLEKQVGNRIKFHIAYYQKPSIGFMVGTIFKTENIAIYQNNDFKNRFSKVFDITSRAYKEKTNNFEHYTITKNLSNKDSNEVLIVLNSSSHNVNINADALVGFKNYVIMDLNSNGTIPYEIDWINHAKEIYSVMNELQISYKSIYLAHAMPEALSLVLGMAIENYWNLTITQYNHETNDYDNVYIMNKIKYFD